MTDIGPVVGAACLPAPERNADIQLIQELMTAFSTGRTGLLHIIGDPGGGLQLIAGMVVTADSPGAPGMRELLARRDPDRPGRAELRAIEELTVLDALFAMAAGRIDGCRWDGRHTRPSTGGRTRATLDPPRLAAETQRRMRALAGSRVSPQQSPLALTEYGRTLRGAPPGWRREILLQVNAARSCRDIAFRLSRGLYPITAEVARMVTEQVLHIVPPRIGRHAGAAATWAPLPRRRRDASGINELFPPRLTESR